MIWFGAKRYGWGWTPVTWQGWVATVAYIVAVVGWLVYRRNDLALGLHFDVLAAWPMLVLTALFIAVCWIKGERPRWRWGK